MGKRCQHPRGLRPRHASLLLRPPHAVIGHALRQPPWCGAGGAAQREPRRRPPVSVSASPDAPIKRTKAPCGGPNSRSAGSCCQGWILSDAISSPLASLSKLRTLAFLSDGSCDGGGGARCLGGGAGGCCSSAVADCPTSSRTRPQPQGRRPGSPSWRPSPRRAQARDPRQGSGHAEQARCLGGPRGSPCSWLPSRGLSPFQELHLVNLGFAFAQQWGRAAFLVWWLLALQRLHL